MIPDPRWCDAHPARCAASVADTRDAWQAVGFAMLAGFVVAVLLLGAGELVREGRYRPALGCALAAVTVAAIALAGL